MKLLIATLLFASIALANGPVIPDATQLQAIKTERSLLLIQLKVEQEYGSQIRALKSQLDAIKTSLDTYCGKNYTAKESEDGSWSCVDKPKK